MYSRSDNQFEVLGNIGRIVCSVYNTKPGKRLRSVDIWAETTVGYGTKSRAQRHKVDVIGAGKVAK